MLYKFQKAVLEMKGEFETLALDDQAKAIDFLAGIVQEIHDRHYRCRVEEEAEKTVAGEAERILMERFTGEYLTFPFDDQSIGEELFFTNNKSDSVIDGYEATTASGMNKSNIDEYAKDDQLPSSSQPADREYACSVCGYIAPNRKALYRHGLKLNHKTKEDITQIGSFACQFCNFTTNKKFNYTRHLQRAHFSIRNHICEVCQRRFKDNDTLKAHVKNVHSKVISNQQPLVIK